MSKIKTHVDAKQFVIVSSGVEMGVMAEAVRKRLKKRYHVSINHFPIEYTTFKNNEVCPQIPRTVRRQHVLFFHPLQFPTPNDALAQMLIVNDALNRASAASITLVLPYMAYLRQDRKDKPRVPITARMLANVIEANRCVQNIVTFDMHTEQAAGFFDIPVDNVLTHALFAKKVKKILGADISRCVVVGPDIGSGKRARMLADALGGLPVALIDKRRSKANTSEVMHIVGEPVRGKIVLINDDMIDTGGTILNGAKALLQPEHGAIKVYVMATHGIFSGEAEKNLAEAQIPVLISDTIPRPDDYYERNTMLTVVSVKKILASVLYQQMRHGGSVSKLSDK